MSLSLGIDEQRDTSSTDHSDPDANRERERGPSKSCKQALADLASENNINVCNDASLNEREMRE